MAKYIGRKNQDGTYTTIRISEQSPLMGKAAIIECPDGTEPTQAQLTGMFSDHKNQRAANYPKIGDQLDALWHAMDDGTLPRVEPFYSAIAAVKQKYPKP